MKKETGGILNKKIINENRNDRNYHNASTSQNHSKSPSHTGNYLNVSKSKNQFSQSQIDRSYTGASNNIKNGHSSNNNQMAGSKYRDKSMPGSTSTNNYLESQSSNYSNYASYKDNRSKSRDLSGSKQINSTPTHKKVSSMVVATPKGNVINNINHNNQVSHTNFSHNNYVNPNVNVNNYPNYLHDREKNSYNNLNVPQNVNMNLTMKNNMISSQSSQMTSKNLKSSNSSNYMSPSSNFSNSNVISSPVYGSNYLNIPVTGPNQNYNYISNNHHSGNKVDPYVEDENYLKYSQTSKKSKVPPSGKSNVTSNNNEKYRDRSAKSNTGNSNLNSSQTSVKNYDEYKGNFGNLSNKSQTEDSVYTKYKQIKRNSVPSGGNSYIENSPSTKNINNGNNYQSKNQVSYVDSSPSMHENNIYNNTDKINSLKFPSRLESNFSFKSYTENPHQYKAPIQQIPIQTSGNKKTYANTHTENSLQISKYSNHSQHDTNNLNDSRIMTDTSKSRQNFNIHLEKKDSFSLLKINSVGSGLGSEPNHQTADSNLNKETSDSLKYRMTNTHSSVGNTAIHSLEEVKALFNKLDPEEYHLVSVNLIQSSKQVVRMHEHVPDRDNLFTTVTKCEERDL
jgi:hypothetical protein